MVIANWPCSNNVSPLQNIAALGDTKCNAYTWCHGCCALALAIFCSPVSGA